MLERFRAPTVTAVVMVELPDLALYVLLCPVCRSPLLFEERTVRATAPRFEAVVGCDLCQSSFTVVASV